jgi:hypothetical protein
MPSCKGKTLKGQKCTRKVTEGEKYCYQHNKENNKENNKEKNKEKNKGLKQELRECKQRLADEILYSYGLKRELNHVMRTAKKR